MTSVSIVSVTYYTGPVLFDMIRSALAQPHLAELVLVNNGNPLPIYRQLEAMAEEEPRIRLISGYGNVGFASACNRGAKEATGSHLLFLNPDCVLPADFTSRVISESENLARPHLIGARVVEPDGKEQSGSRRAIL